MINFSILVHFYLLFSRYCLDVARSLWSYYQQLPAAELYSLCDLADQIRFSAAAEPQDTAWIEMLRGMAATVQPQQQQQTVNEGGNLGSEQEQGGQEQNVNVENAQAHQEENRHINRFVYVFLIIKVRIILAKMFEYIFKTIV